MPTSSAPEFRTLSEAGLTRWQRPARFDWLDRLGTLPLADTELLNTAHHCPIAIRIGSGGPHVLCVTRRAALRSALVGRDGLWSPRYAPLALRAMPFRPGSTGEIEIAPELARVTDEDGFGFADDDGKPARDYAFALSLVERLVRSAPRLGDAAKLLVAADILVPLTLPGPDQERALLTVSPTRLADLPPHRAATLTADGCLPLDLASAALFSQRLLVSGLVRDERAEASRAGEAPAASMLDQGLGDALDTPFRMDESMLFSFEDYVAGQPRS